MPVRVGLCRGGSQLRARHRSIDAPAQLSTCGNTGGGGPAPSAITGQLQWATLPLGPASSLSYRLVPSARGPGVR